MFERRPLLSEAVERLDGLAPAAPVGARAPLADRAAGWVRDVLERLDRGSLVVIDYARPTAELARLPMEAWLRTYAGHERGSDPLVAPGTRDITCDVPLDQLPPPHRVLDQATWLDELGLADLAEEGRRIWEERGHVGDLAALEARSRIGEAQALSDPSGLGGFTVLEYRR